MEISSISGKGEITPKGIKTSPIIQGGTAKVNFDKQIIKIDLRRCKKIKELTCDEAYHLWSILNNVFTTKDIAKKIKVYNALGEEIVLNSYK